MKLIYDIVKKLRKQEIRQIRHNINNASFSYDRVGKLFELVTRYDEKDEEFYAQKLYQKPPDNTFRVTKSRLKRMLENVILNDKSLTGYSSEVINQRLQVKKKLLQGEILLGRGAYNAGKHLLLQVISTARKFDLYHEAFQAQLLLYRHQSVLTSVKEYQKHTDALLASNEQIALIDEAQILQYHIANLMLQKTLKVAEMQQVRAQIDRMAVIAEKTQHPQVQSGYFLTENFYYQVNGKFDLARSFCEKYLQILQEDPAQESSRKIANAYAQLAKISIQLSEWDQARIHNQEVLARCEPEEMNYLIALELAFRIEFFSGNYSEAVSIVETAKGHPRFDASKMLEAQWHYFNACLLFSMKKFQAAYLELNHTTPLLTDKYGRNLSIRLLEIMILFELDHHDIMETKILNMRQYIKRTQKKDAFFRPNALIRMLVFWYRKSYDFMVTLSTEGSQFRQLQDYHETTPYDTSDFELIRLEQWMQQKA